MDTYFNTALFISCCLFPVWWGLVTFAFKKLSEYEHGPNPPKSFIIGMGFACAIATSMLLPFVPFVLAAIIAAGGPAWLVYKGLTWVSNNVEFKVGTKE